MGLMDSGEVVPNLFGRLVLAKDDFRSALTELTMEIEGGVGKLLEGELRELFEG